MAKKIVESSSGDANGYVGSQLPVYYNGEFGPVINLGLASNPSGSSLTTEQIFGEMNNRRQGDNGTEFQLADYDPDVNHKRIKRLLADGIGIHGLEDDKDLLTSVILHPNGSYGAGDEMVRALGNLLRTRKGNMDALIYAPTYSFPNVYQYAERNRVAYSPLPPGNDLFQEGSISHVLEMGRAELQHNIVYYDYPNNPSGKADKSLLRKVVAHVQENGGVPFVDLAFAEVLGDEFRDAIQFTIDHGGVCVGSMTKTMGLPAVRAGYAIINRELGRRLYNSDSRLVFGLSLEAKAAYRLLFTESEDGTLAKRFARQSAQYNKASNTVFYEALEGAGLRIAPTLLETPIQVIQSDEPLYNRIARVGIATESLKDYGTTVQPGVRGYGDTAIRVLTPRPAELQEVARRIRIAVAMVEPKN